MRKIFPLKIKIQTNKAECCRLFAMENVQSIFLSDGCMQSIGSGTHFDSIAAMKHCCRLAIILIFARFLCFKYSIWCRFKVSTESNRTLRIVEFMSQQKHIKFIRKMKTIDFKTHSCFNSKKCEQHRCNHVFNWIFSTYDGIVYVNESVFFCTHFRYSMQFLFVFPAFLVFSGWLNYLHKMNRLRFFGCSHCSLPNFRVWIFNLCWICILFYW